jgi:ferric-dicitrate binding protein FerR (iron transport regulator)
MSFRASKDSAIRAVHALSREAADMPLPPVDWERIEQKLFSSVGEIETPAPAQPIAAAVAPTPAPARGFGSVWTAAFAAAAAVALVAGIDFGESPVPAPASARVSRAPRPLRGLTLGDSLELGGSVASKTQPLAYEKPGVVTFTLAPSSRVELVAADQDGDKPGALTIALTEGSVHAEVEPQADGEAFAVEVGHTRVAVHGTSFTVTRDADHVVVEVAHGSVAVGPTGYRGSTQGWLLVGPDRARFSLDGAREAEWLALPPGLPLAVAPVAAGNRSAGATDSSDGTVNQLHKPSSAAALGPSAARSNRGVTAHAEAAATHAEAAARAPEEAVPVDKPQEVAARGPVEQEEAAKAAIMRGLESCYERQVSSSGVSFSIVSSLTLSILPNGSVREGLFNPPLSPTLMNCARDAITMARFPRGESTREVRLPVNLARTR